AMESARILSRSWCLAGTMCRTVGTRLTTWSNDRAAAGNAVACPSLPALLRRFAGEVPDQDVGVTTNVLTWCAGRLFEVGWRRARSWPPRLLAAPRPTVAPAWRRAR